MSCNHELHDNRAECRHCAKSVEQIRAEFLGWTMNQFKVGDIADHCEAYDKYPILEGMEVVAVEANGTIIKLRGKSGLIGYFHPKFLRLNEAKTTVPALKVCTCGGAKLRSTHSSWCDAL